jgi:hypothetical protein
MPFLLQSWYVLLAELFLARRRTDKTLPPILSPRACGMLVGGMATHVRGGEYSRPKVPKVVVFSSVDFFLWRSWMQVHQVGPGLRPPVRIEPRPSPRPFCPEAQ